jgi:hypothetical protein
MLLHFSSSSRGGKEDERKKTIYREKLLDLLIIEEVGIES